MKMMQELDYILVPLGLGLMVAYHAWLLRRILKHPMKTVVGVNAINRRIWVHTMMQDPSKTGVLAVQSLRNNIMASTLLASMAITLSSVIAIIMTNGGGGTTGILRHHGVVYGNKTDLAFSIKFSSILVCFLLAFLLIIQSIRYYSHASILINVPVNKASSAWASNHLTAEHVEKVLNRGGYFWSLGLRAFYFSLPLFMWIFGPIPMVLCCLVLVVMLYFLDLSFDEVMSGGDGKVGDKEVGLVVQV
ncbi:hypothetical protein QJS04_geneDACA013214 [Acorus gramineus]|uniref:DUF599 domain-containing protein n=1 Tax=Acorus gramineus TaxID=55184 RepID=A0AAV9BEK4_ACOGR|nr:hypothetical protein QJS04_geneDACA013214 [Acorus gramineus]